MGSTYCGSGGNYNVSDDDWNYEQSRSKYGSGGYYKYKETTCFYSYNQRVDKGLQDKRCEEGRCKGCRYFGDEIDV